ncbi:MAG: hypothetical protein ABSD31_08905 [Candidatus Binataceae bacterium]
MALVPTATLTRAANKTATRTPTKNPDYEYAALDQAHTTVLQDYFN